jgi:hypothetical protein
MGTGCVKTRQEISFLRFDRAGCAVSHDRLSGKGRGIPWFGNISSFHTAWALSGLLDLKIKRPLLLYSGGLEEDSQPMRESRQEGIC